MRNTASWIWISLGALALLASGVVGLVRSTALDRAYTAVESALVKPVEAAPAVPVPVVAPEAAATSTDSVPVVVGEPAPGATPVDDLMADEELADEPVQTAALPVETASSPEAPASTPATAGTGAPNETLPVQIAPVVPVPSAATVTPPSTRINVVKPVVDAPSPRAKKDARVIVEMLPEVRIRGARVMLSDVAKVRAVAGVTLPRLQDVEVARVEAGSTRSVLVNRPIVRSALVNEGVDMRDARFVGASSTRVVPERNVVQTVDLMKAAQQFLMKELLAAGYQKKAITVRPILDVPSVVVPDGRVVIVPSRTDESRPLGAVGIALDIQVDGTTVKTTRVNFQVLVAGRVVVARAQVNKGDVIGPDDVGLETRDLGSLPEGAVTSVAAVVGKASRITLRPGTVVTDSMAALAPVVRKGAQVTIIYNTGKVNMSLNGVALRDGQAGETIPVKNVDTSKVLDAVVRDRSTVEVGGAPVSMVEPQAPPAPTTAIPATRPIPTNGPAVDFTNTELPAPTSVGKQQNLPAPNYVQARPKTAWQQANEANKKVKVDQHFMDFNTQKPLPLH